MQMALKPDFYSLSSILRQPIQQVPTEARLNQLRLSLQMTYPYKRSWTI